MAYQADDYADLITTTLRHLEKTTWADIVVDNQRHIAMPQVLRKKSVQFGSGYGHQFNCRFFSNNAARNVKLNEVDNPTTADTQATGNVPWRHTETHWALEERIISMNRAPSRLVSLLQTSRVDAMTDLAELMETNFWSKPSSASDELSPFGVPSWVVYNSASDGFTGGNPAAFPQTGAGNIDSDVHARWKNWSSTYTTLSSADCIRKWREASTKTEFRPPVDGPFNNTRSQYGFYTNYTTLGQLEEILYSQNDNLGSDVASLDGQTKFRRTPVTWVPWFDNNSSKLSSEAGVTNPIYGLNWASLAVAFLSGEYLKTSKVAPHPLHHRTLTSFTDCTYQYFCKDRRSNFVLSQ